jgi:glutamine amidotransferase
MNIVIIKYNAGNTRSVELALERLGYSAKITNQHEEILAADKVIFPGVGQANAAMQSLKENALDQLIPQLKQPVLGICLGMQLLCSDSEEGNTSCLNIIPDTVKRFVGTEKIPHMGWNTIGQLKTKLFDEVVDNSYCYFVHGYYVPLSEYTIATCEYILPFSAAVQHQNFYGVQFHPEKSGEAGAQILKNFLAL